MRTASQVLDQEHLDIRHQLLEIAAFLDRLDASEDGAPDDDLRLERIRATLAMLAADEVATDRCKRVSLLFSGDDASL